MARQTPLAPGEFYHIYNRGVDKRDIFINNSDYERFVSLLYLSNSPTPVRLERQGRTLTDILNHNRPDTIVDICSYCLMPNHFHILIKEKEDRGISRFMHKLSTAYTMYFNARYERSGTLFEGTYKTRHVSTDVYLQYLIAYIHLNPVKLIDPLWKENGIQDREESERLLNAYQYSSFLDFAAPKRPENIILNKDVLPEYFESPEDFKGKMYEWLSFKVE